MCYKNNCGRFYINLILEPPIAKPVSFALNIYTQRMDQQTYKKSHSSPEKCYLKPTELFDREKPR